MEAYASGEREERRDDRRPRHNQQFFERFQGGRTAMPRLGAWSASRASAVRIAESMQDIELEEAVSQSLAEFASKAAREGDRRRGETDFQPRLIRITPDLVEYWLLDHPDHPDLLGTTCRSRSRSMVA